MRGKLLGFLIVVFSYLGLADISEDFASIFGYLLGEASFEYMLVKFVMWVVLLFVLFSGLIRTVFPGNGTFSFIVSFIIATVGVRFVPENLLEIIGQFYYLFILLVVLVVVPLFFMIKYFGVSAFKAVIYLLILVSVVWYIFWRGVDRNFGDISSFVINYMQDHMWIPVVLTVIFLFLLWRKLK